MWIQTIRLIGDRQFLSDMDPNDTPLIQFLSDVDPNDPPLIWRQWTACRAGPSVTITRVSLTDHREEETNKEREEEAGKGREEETDKGRGRDRQEREEETDKKREEGLTGARSQFPDSNQSSWSQRSETGALEVSSSLPSKGMPCAVGPSRQPRASYWRGW